MRKILVCLLVGFIIFPAQAEQIKLEKPIDFNYSKLREVPQLLTIQGLDSTNKDWIKAALDNSESELIELFRLYSDIDVSENASAIIQDFKDNKIKLHKYAFNSREEKEFFRTLTKDGEMLIRHRAGNGKYVRYVKYEWIKTEDLNICPVERKKQRKMGIRNRKSRGCYRVSELEVFNNYESPVLNLTTCANKYNLFGYLEFSPIEKKYDTKFRCEFSGGYAVASSKNN